MSVEREHIVTSVVAKANQRVTSRVRLQKSFYILDQLGLGEAATQAYARAAAATKSATGTLALALVGPRK